MNNDGPNLQVITLETRSTTDNKPAELPQIDTVLVIDDDEGWFFIYKNMFRKVGVGNQLLTANNGLEGLKILQNIAAKNEKLPELIFLDIKMPVMDGFDFLDEVTKSADLDLSQTKIFICTSSFHPKDKEKANLYPISGFITKPLTQDILRDILK
jgi:CheY-like chemotaxis protein